MRVNDLERLLLERFPEASVKQEDAARTGIRWSVPVPISGIRDAAKIFDSAGFFLETITALDFADTFEVVYHFNCYEPRSRVCARVLCGHDQSLSSISDIFRGAGWLEREVHEFFGIAFPGNPDLRRLLLPEDADYYPLRKEFTEGGTYHKREEIYG